MTLKISDRASKVRLSPTLAVFNLTAEKKRQGLKLWDFGVGEPVFETPSGIADKGIDAIQKGYTKYTENQGIIELRTAVSHYLNASFNINYPASDILISNGAKQSVFNAIAALVNPGDKVLVPLPCYPSYPEMIKFCGAEPRLLQCDPHSLKITPSLLKIALQEDIKGIILNQPSNPSGVSYKKSELEEFANVIGDKNIFIISDEIYSGITAENFKFCSVAEALPQFHDRIILVGGASKNFAMTGWRIGFAAGPPEVIHAMNLIQNQTTGHPGTMNQHAAIEAFRHADKYINTIKIAFIRRRKIFRKELEKIPLIKIHEGEGAFYYFTDFSKYLPSHSPSGKKISDTQSLSLWLLDEHGIVCIPGEAFEMPGFLRLSFTADEKHIIEGLSILKEAMNQLELK